MKFSIRISIVNVTKSCVTKTVDLVIFTEEILNGKLNFFAVLAV